MKIQDWEKEFDKHPIFQYGVFSTDLELSYSDITAEIKAFITQLLQDQREVLFAELYGNVEDMKKGYCYNPNLPVSKRVYDCDISAHNKALDAVLKLLEVTKTKRG